MNKEIIKGFLIVAVAIVGVSVFTLVAVDNGPQKLNCVLRAIFHGVALTNVSGVCGL